MWKFQDVYKGYLNIEFIQGALENIDNVVKTWSFILLKIDFGCCYKKYREQILIVADSQLNYERCILIRDN